MTRSHLGAIAIAAASLLLWALLGAKLNAASLVAGIAVAVAIGVWASIAEI